MTGIRTPFDSCGLRPRVPCWHMSQPVLCAFVRTYVCVYTGATVGGGVDVFSPGCAVATFITCTVHDSVDLPSDFVYR